MTQWIHACEPGWEQRLSGELARMFPDASHAQLADGWVSSQFDADPTVTTPCVALASQCLPNAEPIEAESVAAWGRSVGGRLMEALAKHDGPWRLHVFGVYRRGGPVGPRRCELIAEQIEELLRKKQRRLLRTRQPAAGPWIAGEALVQIGLVDAAKGFFSVCLPPLRERLRRMVVPFPGGVVPIEPDRRAPSRAFAKLLEAEVRLGRRIEPGESCVDLGSSPGSWAYVALHRGARVVAVDRSPLRADLMAHPALEFRCGDAFRVESPEPVDWLLCDVIAAPRRSSELLQRWLTQRGCRQFVVTIKLHGASEDHELEPLKAWLATAGVEFHLRRLTNNKNEVTAVGRLSEPSYQFDAERVSTCGITKSRGTSAGQ